jgi:hypothetical protein
MMQGSTQLEEAYKQLLAAVQSRDRATTLRTVLHKHPELLSPRVETLIDETEASYSAVGEPWLSESFFEPLRNLLRRCREVGIDSAVAEQSR